MRWIAAAVLVPVVACSGPDEDEREGQRLPSPRPPDPLVAVHLASPEPREGWTPVSFEGRDLFLEPEPVVADPDVRDVVATRSDEGVVLDVHLTAAGAERLRRVTAALIGEPLAIVLESRVVSAPVIRSAIAGGRVQMAVPASAVEAARIAERIRSRWPGTG